MNILDNNDYKFISNLVEEKISLLRENNDFNEKYMRLSDLIEELETTLSENQKSKFSEIINLFYQTEEYYFALSYSLGVKYGQDLKNL